LFTNFICFLQIDWKLFFTDLFSLFIGSESIIFVIIVLISTISEKYKFGATARLKILITAFPTETYLFFMIKSIEHHLSPGKNTFESFTQSVFGSPIAFRTNKKISNEVIQIYHLHTLIGENLKNYKKQTLAYIGIRQAVEAQIKFAADNPKGNRLFVSTQNPQVLLKANNFNDYIASVCEKENICNADGSVAAPTSHQFRHNAVTERIDSGLYSRKMLKQELNHNNIDSQLTYYGKSAYDRLVEDKSIIGSVYNENAVNTVFDGRNKQTNEVKIIPKFQYDKLFKSPSIRFLPEGQLCSACSCKPLFESCVTCDNFVPDPKYYEDVLNIVILLEAKLEQIKKAGNNKPAEKIIQKQIETYKLYLKKVGTFNEKEN